MTPTDPASAAPDPREAYERSLRDNTSSEERARLLAATGGPSDASPEPLTAEEVLDNLEAAINASQWVTAGNRLDQLRRALGAERASHPPAASAADRDALYRRIHALPGVPHHGKGEQCYPITDAVLAVAALAAAPPRATEPAEAGLDVEGKR